jgi:hypothetical protein
MGQSWAKPNLDIVKKYAPLIYLHPQESYMPSTLEEFGANVHMICNGRSIGKNILQIQPSDLPADSGAGRDDDHPGCIMQTNIPMRNAYDVIPFFHGRKPTSSAPVPVYVFTYDVYGPDSFTAQYNTFYPYNEGKDACPLFVIDGHCTSPSGRKVFDDHVADWELMTILFNLGRPVSVHVGAHGNDQGPGMYNASTYFPNTNTPDGHVVWESTITQYQMSDALSGIGARGPWYLSWQGDHPIVYSAKGSHGIWASPGQHVYGVAAGDFLTDDAGKGTPWETWRSVVDTSDPKYQTLLYRYKGVWGNDQMGNTVCDYVKDTIHDLPLLTLIQLGYEWITGQDACDRLDTALRQTWQLNGGPHLPDRNRDKKYVSPTIPGLPQCHAMMMQPATGMVLYGLGRDNKLYRKTLDPDGGWSAVPGYASTHKVTSITAKTDGTLISFDPGGQMLELPPPYSGDWHPSEIASNSRANGLGMTKDGQLLAVTKADIEIYNSQNHAWSAVGRGLSFVPDDTAPKTIAVMPNENYLLGAPLTPKGYAGYLIEYKLDDGVLEAVSFGVAHRRPVLDQPYYPKNLTNQFVTIKPQSSTYLPNGMLVFSTETGSDRLFGWWVNSCGSPDQKNFSNVGAPPFGFPGTTPGAPQWQSLTVVTPH